MSILIYLDAENGKLKKTAFEVASYAQLAQNQQDSNVVAVAINIEDVSALASYGVNKVVHIKDEKLKNFSAKAYASVLKQVAENEEINTIILSSSANSRTIAPILAVQYQASYIPNVISLPENPEKFEVKTNVFSNKAFAITKANLERKVICLSANSFGIKEKKTEVISVDFTPSFTENDFDTVTLGVEKNVGKVSLDDASIVVAGGRGLKSAENWHLVESLAEVLGAAMACSKPVSDMGWRPHSEHVGQTGKPIAANLYIAIGISGAIQHLAGVNASKVKVVINNDENAPFFKAADYGIVGDAFEIVPKLVQKLKDFKNI